MCVCGGGGGGGDNDKLYIYTHIIPTRYTQSLQKYASRRIEAVVGLLSLWSKWLVGT